VTQKEDGIFISQDKYVSEILKKFNYTDVKYASTPVDLENPLVKDGDADDVDIHLYRSMIGSLMYLTTFRPDIMFAVCLWYSRDSPFKLVAYTDSDYVRATQDRKSTTGGYQFLGNWLISWQCKKQTVVATYITEAEYMVAASCCGQLLFLSTDTECLVLSPNLKLPDESQILLKLPRNDNMYSFDMKNIVPKDSLTCLVAKATSDESML
ncbi:hypothetical protein Tco_1513687, partial [Tanacetum coccineum]